jgi:hypothetical protein
VPHIENGFLHYIIMEIVAVSDGDSGWAVKDNAPPQPFPIATGSASVSFTAMNGLDHQRLPKTEF